MIWTARVLRALAVAIAVLAAIDPSVPMARTDRALVAVIDAGDADFAARLSSALASSFDVHSGSIAGAAATVVAGDALPSRPVVTSGALFAAAPPAVTPRLMFESVIAPSIAPAGSKVPSVVSIRAGGLSGRSVAIELFAGSLAADSAERVIAKDDERATVTLSVPPSGAGLATARLVIRDAAIRAVAAERHIVTDVRDLRWRVLVADPRPSWTSTFVRRALENDRRFDVVSRVATSTTVAAASGTAPALTDTAALMAFDAVVVGAPDALSTADARSLDRYARDRGGAIVLLADRLETGPAAPLFGGVALTDVHGVERVKIAGAAGDLVATELALPQSSTAVTPLARAVIGGRETSVIWQSPLGAGRVIVNGALDAWRYRTREGGGFARFWADTIAAAASASPAPVEITLGSRRVGPGSPIEVRAVVRDAQLSDPARPAPVVELNGPLQFWPAAERGVFHATFMAPDTPGNYEVQVEGAVGSGARVRGDARYSVAAQARPEPSPELLAAWTTARGGSVLTGDIADTVSRIRTAVTARAERRPTPLMRSVWWLPVFMLLVSGEWWIRRRRGDR